VQTIAGFFGDPNLKLLESYVLDRFTKTDGTFDIQLSAEPPGDGGAWIALVRDAVNTVIVREAFNDWSVERGARLQLEILEPAPRNPGDAEAEMVRKLDAALRMIDFCIATFGPEFCSRVKADAGENNFLHVDTSRDEEASNPGVAYLPAAYRIAADEALVIAFDLPRARYWSIHIADRWSRTIDYARHQSSLNGAQAHVGTDGHVQIVLAATDPGVANWLDPAGQLQGMLLLRWYGADRAIVPTVTRIPLNSLTQALHNDADVPRVTPKARAAIVGQRRAAITARYQR
jgi:hypothetical protein